MMQLLDLNLLERLALWVLARSPRTSLVVVKEMGSPAMFVVVDSADEMLDSLEPTSMLLERLYHAPSHGELE
jgi:hypothetical protein